MVFDLKQNNRFYNFQLNKLQMDLDEIEKPSDMQPDPDNPGEEMKKSDEAYEAELAVYDENKSLALQEGFST